MTCIATHVKPGTNGEEVDYLGLVGTPIPNVELKVVDEDGRDVSHVPDVKGEICVRELTVTKGYFEIEKTNRESNVLHLDTANVGRDGWTIVL